MYCIWSRQQTRVFVYLVSVFSQVWRVYCGLWHYCSTKRKEPVHSHRKRECGNFVYSLAELSALEVEIYFLLKSHADDVQTTCRWPVDDVQMTCGWHESETSGEIWLADDICHPEHHPDTCLSCPISWSTTPGVICMSSAVKGTRLISQKVK